MPVMVHEAKKMQVETLCKWNGNFCPRSRVPLKAIHSLQKISAGTVYNYTRVVFAFQLIEPEFFL